MDCLSSIVKYLLYVFNLIFVLIGILLIIFGSISLSQVRQLYSLPDTVNVALIPIIVLVLGIIVFFVAFFGCCGSIKNNVCLMSAYNVCMTLVLLAILALTIYAYGWKQEFLNSVSEFVNAAWKESQNGNTQSMNAIEVIFNCCGYTNYSDYSVVPNSCCGAAATSCPSSIYTYRVGCEAAFRSFWDENLNVIRYGGIITSIVLLIIICFASCVTNAMKRSRVTSS